MAIPKRTCLVEGCNKPTNRRGFCNAHYIRWWRHGDPLAGRNPPGSFVSCSIEGCGRKRHIRGWCRVHHERWKRYGDPLAGGTLQGKPLQYLYEVALPYQGDDCLVWPFCRTRDGYAEVRRDGRMQRVSRLVCEHIHGQAPTPRHEAAHSCGCGHLGCVTPQHLRWATALENQADMLVHGTRAKGERCGSAKLSEADVKEIRNLKGKLLQREIATQYGISAPHVSRILSNKKWAWLG